jgi:hypothetical protein
VHAAHEAGLALEHGAALVRAAGQDLERSTERREAAGARLERLQPERDARQLEAAVLIDFRARGRRRGRERAVRQAHRGWTLLAHEHARAGDRPAVAVDHLSAQDGAGSIADQLEPEAIAARAAQAVQRARREANLARADVVSGTERAQRNESSDGSRGASRRDRAMCRALDHRRAHRREAARRRGQGEERTREPDRQRAAEALRPARELRAHGPGRSPESRGDLRHGQSVAQAELQDGSTAEALPVEGAIISRIPAESAPSGSSALVLSSQLAHEQVPERDHRRVAHVLGAVVLQADEAGRGALGEGLAALGHERERVHVVERATVERDGEA